MWIRVLLWGGFVLGCSHRLRPEPAVASRVSPIEAARARPLPDPTQARFSIGIRSAVRNLPSTGGALILDRPGRGHLAVLGPLGGPLATLQTDGTGLALAIARDRQHLLAAEADDVLRGHTAGALGLDDLLGVLVGDLPLDDAPVRSERALPDGRVEVILDGPRGSSLLAVLDPVLSTPVSVVARDEAGARVLEVDYDPFEPLVPDAPEATATASMLVPTRLTIEVPALELTAELKFRSWREPSPEALEPSVFGLAPPEGFSTAPMEALAAGLLGSLLAEPPG